MLDIATGTGIWAVEFAQLHPDAQIIGTDLSKIQPTNAPPSCTFIKDDAEEDWVFPAQFDFVHLRFVFSCFDNPRKMMKNALGSMNPGAWIEYQDFALGQTSSVDNNYDGTAFQKWNRAVVAGAAQQLGRDVEVAPRYKEWLVEAGFVDVEEKKLMWPAGPWSDDKRLKLAGLYQQKNFVSGLLLAGWKFLLASGMSKDEAENVIDESKRELLDKGNRFYYVAYVVYGRKP